MAKITITDSDGTTYEFYKFLVLAVQTDGGIFKAIEDESMTKQEAVDIVLAGAEALGEIASGTTTEIEGGNVDGR